MLPVGPANIKARFIEPMLAVAAQQLPEGRQWEYELKLDGYRAIAIKSAGHIQLRSRRNNDFSGRYPGIARALGGLPDDSVLDGEVVALDEQGRPSFNTLQNFGSLKLRCSTTFSTCRSWAARICDRSRWRPGARYWPVRRWRN